MSGILSEEILNQILPDYLKPDPGLPRVGTAVFLDHHGLGMKIVSNLVRTAGYPLVDLGLGADTGKILRGVEEENIQILLISVLMLPSALAVKDLCKAMSLKHPHVRVVAGGAPFSLDPDLGKKTGVHRTAGNAGEIFRILQDLTAEIKSGRTKE